MSTNLPKMDERVVALLNDLQADPSVQKALQVAIDEREMAMQEQVDICEIPAPTFEEVARGLDVMNRMKQYGCTDVTVDEVGNVIALRRGIGQGPKLAIAAHLDTVFPAGTDVSVKRDGHRYTAPGIGDNCSGLRALLQLIRCMNEADIQTQGDVYFVATVGEEGLGDIRGSKHFVVTHPVDGFIAIDNTDIGRILRGAVGSHRYRMTIQGPGGHSYAHFGQVPSAIHAMCLAGAKIAKIKVPTHPKTTFTIGKIVGGTSVNSIAQSCSVEVDMRSINNEELLKLEAQVLRCFEEAIDEENAHWNIEEDAKKLRLVKEPIGDRPAGERPDDCPVIQASRAALAALGKPLTNYGYSSTDANAPVSMGIPATCLSSGGFQYKSHSVHEYFDDIDSHLGPQLLLLTTLALCGTDKHPAYLPIR